jgi:phosphoglycolate phosphatase-like HAD superfamily hydrolase
LLQTVIFDVDGTLVDSVDLHAIAWHEALVKFGHDVSFEKARSQIGKGGDKLIPFFLSEAEQADHGKALEAWREKWFKDKYLPLVRPFSAVPDLLKRVRSSGLKVAVASSAKKISSIDISKSRPSVTWSTRLPLRKMLKNPSLSRTCSQPS